MADDETTRTPRRSAERSVSIPLAAVSALGSAVLAGGGGSYLTGSSVTGAMREGQIRMEGRLDAIRDEVRRLGDDQRAALGRLEATDRALDERLRALELESARRAGAPR